MFWIKPSIKKIKKIVVVSFILIVYTLKLKFGTFKLKNIFKFLLRARVPYQIFIVKTFLDINLMTSIIVF